MIELIGFLLVALAGLYIVWPLRKPPVTTAMADRQAEEDLIVRRDILYREIADLDFDRRLRKIDDADYQSQRRDYLEEASELLERLDQLSIGRPTVGGS
jgi:hypothetical protein